MTDVLLKMVKDKVKENSFSNEDSFKFSYIKIFYDKTVAQNAEYYYNIAKKYKKKIPGIEETIKKTKEDLDKLEKDYELFLKKKEREIKIKEIVKKEWYEKFRYTFTRNGYLVVIGKDATTNEILIKKYARKGDLVIHSEAPGSPFGLIKFDINFFDNLNENIQEVKDVERKDKQSDKKNRDEIKEIVSTKEEDILDAGQFLLSFSNFWKQGFGTGDFFVVLPEQVSKKAPSGEYMGKGSFMIYGDKKVYKNIPLKLGFGFYVKIIKLEDELLSYKIPLSSSQEACKRICSKYIFLEPGNDKVKKINKIIKEKLKLNVEDLPKYIPSNSKVVKR